MDESTGSIAIIGMACHLPGGVKSPSDFWDLLLRGGTGWTEFPTEKLNLDGYYHPKKDRPGSLQTRGANILRDDPRLFDHAFFGLKEAETRTMDPNQRKMLEVVYEAFESAAEPWESFSGSNTGVFVGNFNADYSTSQMYDVDFALPYSATGGSVSILSNRINHVFNLRGPSVTLDTACSSSMYALHMAVLALRNGDCDAAVVGGSNLILSPESQLITSSLGALSSTSKSHTFDASADGYGRGEGFGALYLKRYSDALSGEHPIRALVRGTAINSNGRTAGISHPGVEGQEALIRHAYRAANLSPNDTGYFECHGTGTPVGDPVEVDAIGRVFAEGRKIPLPIGSVKTNLGHGESASGVTSIIKCVLALENGLIPPTVDINRLNPNIDFESARVRVVTEKVPWPRHTLARASINSFGYGGANAHCILDKGDGPRFHRRSMSSPNGLTVKKEHNSLESSSSRSLVLLPFSAHNERSLNKIIEAIRQRLGQFTGRSLAYTLARRSKFRHRSFCVVDGQNMHGEFDGCIQRQHKIPGSKASRLCFVFTGQGAQWQAMGRSLFVFDAVRESIEEQHATLQSLSNAPPWHLRDLLERDSHNLQEDAALSQTACTALQVGLVDLLHSWGVFPSVAVGHSSGEIAAAYACGYISRAEAIVVAYCRGQAVAHNQKPGLMMAVGLSKDRCEHMLGLKASSVQIAAINSPTSITLAGDPRAIEDLHADLQSQGVFTKVLKTGGNAYHSRHMKLAGSFYEEQLGQSLADVVSKQIKDLSHVLPRRRWISTAQPWEGQEMNTVDHKYWRLNLESPVSFHKAVEAILIGPSERPDILVELGPHTALRGPIWQIMTSLEQYGSYIAPNYLGTLQRHGCAEREMLELSGQLFCLGHTVDLVLVNTMTISETGHGQAQREEICHNLPSYQYDYGPILSHETRIAREIRMRRILRHDLLGSLQPGSSSSRPSWRNILRLKDVPWLSDHKLVPNVVLPGSAYVCLAIEALSQHLFGMPNSSNGCFKLRNVKIQTAMVIPSDDFGLETVSTLHRLSNGTNWYEFCISSINPDSSSMWTEHASALVSIDSHSMFAAPLGREINTRYVEQSEWYEHFAEAGLSYGRAFQGLRNVTSDPYKNIARAEIDLKTTRSYFQSGFESPYAIHPASLDICHQLALIACHGGQTGRLKTAFVPVAIEEVKIWPASNYDEESSVGVAVGELRGLRGAHANVQLVDQSGQPRVEIHNLRSVAYHGRLDSRNTRHDEYLRQVWQPDIVTLSQAHAEKLFPPSVLGTEVAHQLATLEELAMLMIIEMKERFASHTPHKWHLKRYLRWIRTAASSDTAVGHRIRNMPQEERHKSIKKILSDHKDIVDVQLADRIFDRIEEILHGRTTGFEALIENDLLYTAYTSGIGIAAAYPQLARILNLIGHHNPSNNILEVGSGTGAATTIAMRTLGSSDAGPKRYATYTFTDVSPAFFTSAQDKFASYKSMTYKVFDMNHDPVEQDIETQYDVVIASQCLHVAKNLGHALRNIRQIMKPGARLIMLETTRPIIGHNLIYGTFSDWWHDDDTDDSPFLAKNEWDKALASSGFSGIDIELKDFAEPYSIVSTMVSTAITISEPPSMPLNLDKIFIVSFDRHTSWTETLSTAFKHQGLDPKLQTLEYSQLPQGCRVVLCVNSENEGLVEMLEERFLQLKDVIRKARSLLFVTIGDALRGGVPRSAVATGLARMLCTEMPESQHGILILEKDIDPDGERSVVQEIVNRESKIHHGDADREIAIKDSIAYVNRLVFDTDLNQRYREIRNDSSTPEMIRLKHAGPVMADFSKPGLISSLYFCEDEKVSLLLPDDYIEIKTAAIGLNWKDLAICTGKFDMNEFSSECAGVVVRCGEKVQDLRPGDRVCALAWGKYASTMRFPAKMAQRLQPGDSLADFAGVPLIYCTAHYALNHVARLQRGERVLIQGATGGLGLAAIQIARNIGAQIFATAGTKEKVQYLTKECGIDASRIFSSRNQQDLHRMQTATNFRGFNVIFSTSNADMMHESWRQIAPRGRFIDLGRLDVQSQSTLAMDVFDRNAVYASFDLSVMASQDSVFCARLLKEVMYMIRSGWLEPIIPTKIFDISNLEQALLYFSRGKHIGKIVVSYQNDESLIKVSRKRPRAKFDPAACYLVIGGLGGFGRGIVEWMIAKGARHLEIWSRSGEAPKEAQALLQDCAKRHIDIKLVKCDITDKKSMDEAMTQSLISRSEQIRGIIHAAVTFCDQAFEIIPNEQWRLGLSAKVIGTENLHAATLAHNLALDFFVMTSSYEAVLALPTQAAYCAANSFQDAFARYRRSHGLPGSAIALGLITEIGEVGQRDITRMMIDRNNLYGTGELDTLSLLEAAFLPEPEPGDVRSFDASNWRSFDHLAAAQITTCLEPGKLSRKLERNGTDKGTPRWMMNKMFNHIVRAMMDRRNTQQDPQQLGASTPPLLGTIDLALRASRPTDARVAVISALKERIASLLQINADDIDEQKSVAAYGIDSLIAVELRSWLITTFECAISLLKILDEGVQILDIVASILEERLATMDR